MLILEDNAGRNAYFRQTYPDAAMTESAEETIRLLGERQFSIISLDHDLNGETFVDSARADCGMEVVRWLVANPVEVERIIIHTANPMASDLMCKALKDAGYNVEQSPFGGQFDYSFRW